MNSVVMWRGGVSSYQGIFDILDVRIKQVGTVNDARTVNFDYLVLPGGCDVSPHLYDQQPHPYLIGCEGWGDTFYGGGYYPKRDLVEEILFRRAYEARKPILGICRGHQLINVLLGGTLYQDIGLDLNIDHPKRTFKSVSTKGHIVMTYSMYHNMDFVEYPLVSKIPSMKVNSLHHQAVDKLAPTLEVIAEADDGIVEAIWNPDRPVLGVQWHPEMMCAHELGWLELFKWFLEGYPRNPLDKSL